MELSENPDQLITMADLADLLAVSVPSLYVWQNKGIGPRKIKLSGRTVRYRTSDVREWLATRETV